MQTERVINSEREAKSKDLLAVVDWYPSLGSGLLFCYCLFAPLSIGASQAMVVALVLLWIYAKWKEWPLPAFDHYSRMLLAPIGCWILVTVISSLVGLNFFEGFSNSIKLGFYALFPFAVRDTFSGANSGEKLLFRMIPLLLILFVSQSFAAFHTLGSELFNTKLPPKIPGALTESGQLVIVFPLLVALFLGCFRKWKRESVTKNKRIVVVSVTALMSLLASVGIILCWPTTVSSQVQFANSTLQIIASTFLIMVTAFSYFFVVKADRKDGIRLLRFLVFALTLIMVALVLNLKRGPWAGIGVTLVLFGLLASKRLAVITLVTAISVLTFVSPARERLMNYADDFYIVGGRSQMWEIGVSLLKRYPLGLGLENVEVMQSLDPSLPRGHRHMHNNLLNVAVETGWLGAAIFCWWMLVPVLIGFHLWFRLARGSPGGASAESLALLALVIGAGSIGWQIAGLTEYNFGDAEIRLLAFFQVGLLLAIGLVTRREQKLERRQP